MGIARMSLPETQPDLSACDDAQSAIDSRGKARFALMIRSAKLTCDQGEFLCIVRDVSEGGAKLKLFHPLPEQEEYHLELSTGDRFPVQQVWEREGLAGYRFANAVDLARFFHETSPYPKRSLRLRLNCEVVLTLSGGTQDATVRDLSREGMCIETDRTLAIEQKLLLEATNVSQRMGSVRWRKKPLYGISLQNILTFEELAQTAALMQLPAELLSNLWPGASLTRLQRP